MNARTAARTFHQFGNLLLAVAAVAFVALPLIDVARQVL